MKPSILPEAELHDLKERIESRQGLRQLSYPKELRMGRSEYELVKVQERGWSPKV